MPTTTTNTKKRFEDAQVGDKLYDRVYGFATVTETQAPWGMGLGIRVAVDNRGGAICPFTYDGKHYWDSAEATLFYVCGEERYLESRPT